MSRFALRIGSAKRATCGEIRSLALRVAAGAFASAHRSLLAGIRTVAIRSNLCSGTMTGFVLAFLVFHGVSPFTLADVHQPGRVTPIPKTIRGDLTVHIRTAHPRVPSQRRVTEISRPLPAWPATYGHDDVVPPSRPTDRRAPSHRQHAVRRLECLPAHVSQSRARSQR